MPTLILRQRFFHLFLALTLLFSGFIPAFLSPDETSAASKRSAVTKAYITPVPGKGYATVSVPPLKKGYQAYVVIQKGKQDYNFRFSKTENIPLPFGSGSYLVTLYQGKGNDFRLVEQRRFTSTASALVTATQQTILSPGVQEAHVQKLMKTTFKDWKKWSASKRVQMVHRHITQSYQYDYKLADNLQSFYLPNIKRLAASKKGICYDLASLTSSLLREMNMPTRIVMGYPAGMETYHSWNEVYVKGNWHIIDTTFDLGAKAKSPFKSKRDYPTVDYRF